MFPAAIALVPLGRFIDRLWGANNGKVKAKLLALVALVVGATAWTRELSAPWFADLPPWFGVEFWRATPGALIVLCWLIGRSMGFGKNAATVIDGKSRKRAWIRALVPCLLAVLVVLVTTLNLIAAICTALAFAGMAVTTVDAAQDYGDELLEAQARGEAIDPKINEKLELRRGTLHGIALMCLFAVLYLVAQI